MTIPRIRVNRLNSYNIQVADNYTENIPNVLSTYFINSNSWYTHQSLTLPIENVPKSFAFPFALTSSLGGST